MENTNENVVNEVKQEAPNANGSNKKLIIKIVVGVLIFLAVIGIAVFMFWYSLANKAINVGKDSVNSIVNLGQSLVDDALEDAGMTDEIGNNVSSMIDNSQKGNKTAITADKFSEIMKEKGYEIIDGTSQYAQYGDYVRKAYGATKSGYQIEFFEFANVANAIDSYNTNKTSFESQKGSNSSYSTISRNNYNTYALTTNGKYQYICRVDNTFVYADVAEEYKDVVKNIINELGY